MTRGHAGIVLTTAVAVIAGVSIALWNRASPSGSAAPAPRTPEVKSTTPPPTRTLTDSKAIFRKAFWREPSPGDQILHAERQEWSDAEGLTQWAWFLVVQPSADLSRYLQKENAFGLVEATSARMPPGHPSWFVIPPGEAKIYQSPRGNLQLIFPAAGGKLYACDSGKAFQRGAPSPAVAKPDPTLPPPSPGPAPGRLPNTPPPIPKP